MLPLILFLSSHQDRAAEFSKLIQPLKNQTATSVPDPRVVAALNLILDEIGEKIRYPSDQKTARKVLGSFEAEGAKLNPDFADEFGQPRLHILVDKKVRVAVVTFGPVSKLGIWEGNKRIPIPAALQWMYPWHVTPQLGPNGTVRLHGTLIHAAGDGTASRFDLVSIRNGRAALEFSKRADHTLDWGGIAVSTDRLTINSLDHPTALMVSAATPLFRRRSIYKITGLKVSAVSSVPLDNELRAVDVWLTAADRAPHPTSQQLLAFEQMSNGMLECSEKVERLSSNKARVKGGGLTFHLKRVNGRWIVDSVSKP